jgi:hypothetical protein
MIHQEKANEFLHTLSTVGKPRLDFIFMYVKIV